MSFTSVGFGFFLLVLLGVYYLVPRKMQIYVLFFGNVVFYLQSGVLGFLFLSTTVVSVFYCGKRIGDLHETLKVELVSITEKGKKEEKKAKKAICKKKQKFWLHGCFCVNFGILFAVKYLDFLLINVNLLWGKVGSGFSLLNMVIPLGLSFYTFQSISYLVDVYWGKEKAEGNFVRYAVYGSYFPQMVQGPISRYGKVREDFFRYHSFDVGEVYLGFVRILYGLFKKLVVADRLLPVVWQMTSQPEKFQGIYFLLAMVLYAVGLYGDFTGGIDITLGVSRMFGIRLQENFNLPYLSKSITEYWRRWHMTMGSWFRDYLFYPLSVSSFMLKVSGVSRKKLGNGLGKRVPFYLSTLLVWFSTGLWHGASWNYIAWGLSNGIVILISQELSPLYQKFHVKYPELKGTRGYGWFQVVRTFGLMCMIRAFDCYGSVGITLGMYGSLVRNFSLEQFLEVGVSQLTISPIQWVSGVFGVSVLLFVGCITTVERNLWDILQGKSVLVKVFVVYFFLFSVLLLGAYGLGYDGTQFIYNQF